MPTLLRHCVSDERIIRESSVSPSYIIPSVLAGLCATAAGYVFLTVVLGYLARAVGMLGVLSSPFVPGAVSSVTALLFAVLPLLYVAFALGATVRLVWLCTSACYTLTNRRLMTQYGILARQITQAELNRVQNVHVEQTLSGRLLNYGDVYVETAGAIGILRLRFVSDPAGWAASLYETVSPAATAVGGFTPYSGADSAGYGEGNTPAWDRTPLG